MSEKSTTPDGVELTRQAFEAGRRHDLDGATRFYAPDAVWDLSDARAAAERLAESRA